MSAGVLTALGGTRFSNVNGAQRNNGRPLRVLLTGGFTLLNGDQMVKLKSRKAAALFSYLALNMPRSLSREHLAGLLWSESEEGMARASLRQTLRSLRGVLRGIGFDGLKSDRNSMALDPSTLEVDIIDALSAVKQEHIAALLLERERTAESMLAGFEDIDPSFRAWLSVQRQTIHDAFVRQLEASLEVQRDHKLALVRNLAIALANLEPSNETACRALMRHYAEVGDSAAALRRYNEIWNLLERDFDVEPSQESQDLAVAIKMGNFPARQHLVPTTLRAEVPAEIAPEKRVVLTVGAFDMQGASLNHHYQIQGFRLDLIASVVRFREWTVVEGDSTQFAVPDVDLRNQYCINAAAFEVDSRVRLVLTLQDRSSGQYVWSDRFDLDVERWFETQRVVVRRIAVALNVHLSAERLARYARDPDLPAHLYDRWLLGQELSFRWRPEDETRAEQVFRDIIAEAPTFAPAYCGMVQITNVRHLVFPGVFRSSDREKEALSMAKTSVFLDPLDSRTHLCLAWSSAMNGNFNQAALSYRLALDLNENDPWTLVSCSLGLAFCGDLDRAKILSDQALDLGMGVSRLHWGYQVCVRFLEHDYASCVEAAERADDMMFGLPAWKAAALYLDGRQREAKVEAQRFLNLIRTRWQGQHVPDDATIIRWILHGYPIRHREDWERLRDGLRGAGIHPPKDLRYTTRAT